MTARVLARVKDPGRAAPDASSAALFTVRRIGYAVLALQCIGFLVWSTILYQRFAVTFDYSVDHQAWFLIAHGDLDPFSSVQGFSLWRDHSEFLLWPLAALYWVCPSGATLLWLQDLCVVAAQVVVFTWLCELAGQHRRRRDAVWLASAGLVLLVANPWTWWTVSNDFHIETFATLFAVLLVRDLVHGRRRAWVWVVPLLACGDVAATSLAGVGLGAVLFSRRTRAQGALLAGLGVAAMLVISLVHGNKGSGLETSYGYLATSAPGTTLTLAGLIKGVATHPGRVLRTLWIKRVDIVANLCPPGLVGIADPLILPLAAIVLVSATLFGGQTADLLAEPIFQSLPVYVLLPLGTVAVLGRLLRRRRLALILAGLLAAQTVGWWMVWGTRTPYQWLRVSAPAAAVLASVEARIPRSDGVFASNGVVGRFSDRRELQRVLLGGETVRIDPLTWWFIITPSQGPEKQSQASAMALIGKLAGPLHATLITDANGVWVFRWTPPPGVRELTVPDGSSPVPAWAAMGAVSRRVTAGPVPEWHLAATGGRGYVADGMEWMKPPGRRYLVSITLSAAAPVNVQVWDDTVNKLLAHRTITRTAGIERVTLPVHAPRAPDGLAYSGWGPFRAQFVPPPPGQRLEVRVWSSGGAAVNVYRADIRSSAKGADPYGGLATWVPR